MHHESKPHSEPLSCLCNMSYAVNKWLHHRKVHDWPSQTALLAGCPSLFLRRSQEEGNGYLGGASLRINGCAGALFCTCTTTPFRPSRSSRPLAQPDYCIGGHPHWLFRCMSRMGDRPSRTLYPTVESNSARNATQTRRNLPSNDILCSTRHPIPQPPFVYREPGHRNPFQRTNLPLSRPPCPRPPHRNHAH